MRRVRSERETRMFNSTSTKGSKEEQARIFFLLWMFSPVLAGHLVKVGV